MKERLLEVFQKDFRGCEGGVWGFEKRHGTLSGIRFDAVKRFVFLLHFLKGF